METFRVDDRMMIAGYELIQELGRGSTSIVYKVKREGRAYALKLLCGAAGQDGVAAGLQFRREAAAIARMDHPSLVKLIEIGEHESQAFVVMELVEGENLGQLIKRRSALDEATVLHLAKGIAGGLAQVHRLGVVHRDVKPDNILIDKNGSVKLIDFGFAVEASGQDEKKEDVAGTFLYAAPEQMGMLKRPVSPRTDLYGLGAVMYECITGDAVFKAESLIELMQMHTGTQASDVRRLKPETRPVLAAMVAKLLAKDPDDRYQSAAGVLEDLENLSALEAEARSGTPVLDSRRDQFRLVHDIPLVGRETELAHLREQWERVAAGKGSFVQIEGEAGSGKTRLNQELLGITATQRALVLKGKCQASEGVPFGVLREALDDAIVRILKFPQPRREKELAALRAASGDFGAILKRLCRGMDKVIESAPELGVLDTASEQERFLNAIAGFFLALAKASGPTLLLIDDIQWIDPNTLQVLKRIGMGIPDCPLLVATAARNDPMSEAACERFVEEVGDGLIRRVVLKPLDLKAVGLYVTAFLGGKGLDESICEKLLAATNGNAFALGEYLRSMLASNIMTPFAGSWKVDLDRLAQLTLSTGVLQLVINRVKLLSPETLRILGVAAISAMNFKPELVIAATKGKPSEVMQALEEALRANLVERLETEIFAFVHDRVREAMIENLTPAQIRDIHQDLAEALQSRHDGSPESAYALARHYVNGHAERNGSRIHKAGLEAGRHALGTFANEMAYELLTHAGKAMASLDQGTESSFELEELTGTAAMRTGRLQEAYQHYAQALKVARTPIDRGTIHNLIGLTLASEGKFGDAWDKFQKALSELGTLYPGSTAVQLLLTLWFWFLALFLGRTGLLHGSARGEARKKREMVSQIHASASLAVYFEARFGLLSMLIIRELYNSHFLGASPEGAKAHVWYGFLMGLFGRAKSVERHGRRSLAICDQLGDRSASATCHALYGYAVKYGGDLVRGQELTRKAIPEVQKYLGAYDNATILAEYPFQCVYQGHSREAVDFALGNLERLDRTNSLVFRSNVRGLLYSQLVLLGRMVEAMKMREEWLKIAALLPKVPYVAMTVHMAQIQALLDLEDLGDEMEGHIRGFLAMKFDEYYNRYAYLLIGYVRLRQLELAEPNERSSARAALKKAIRVARFRALTPVHQCHVLILKAGMAREGGKPKRALHHLERAAKMATSVDSAWGLYQVYLEKARVARMSDNSVETLGLARSALEIASREGWKNRIQRVRAEFDLESPDRRAMSGSSMEVSSRSIMSGSTSSMGATHTMIGESFSDALFKVSIASSSSLDPLVQSRAALDELIKILGAERGFLFIAGGTTQKNLSILGGRDATGNNLSNLTGYSNTVVQKVMESRRPLVVAGTEEAEVLGSQSAVASNLRSIMAAPMIIRDKLIGVIYLDSSMAKGLFNADDVRILTAIGNHIGIAVETSRMAKLEVERRGLEKDLALTATVQSFFLPGKPTFHRDKVHLTGLYQPASTCGGDWWWYGVGNDDSVSVLVGDVTGHGPPSAMLTASTASYFHGLKKMCPGKPINELLVDLNLGFKDFSKGEYFMTMSAVSLDTRASRLRWWNAGSPPVLVMNEAGSVEVLVARGTPLGCEDFALGYKEGEIKPGDRVLVFTDGLSELQLQNGSQLRLKKLSQYLQSTRDLGLEEASGFLARTVNEVRGDRPLDDDLTCVLIDLD